MATAKMKIILPLVVWLWLHTSTTAQSYGGIGFGIKREIFFLNLEDGYFGCQVNESTDVLQLYELSKLCDGAPNCFMGSDELRKELKCTDDCRKEDGTVCQNGACLDNQCHCNDGFGGCSCEVPDENECKYRPCDVFAHCTNTLGSFSCTCFPGYQGNGFHCEDINECDDPAIAARCVPNAECCNLPAHFLCKCLPGFEGDGEVSCRDIDECGIPGACGHNALCHNTPGNYTCVCPDGYLGNPYDGCVDVDECEDPHACGLGALCTNVAGGKQCVCPPGYEGDPYSIGCRDTDECSRHPCGRDALCTNLEGTFSCTCPRGYVGDPLISCTDINECESNPCAANAECLNTNGSFSCLCPEGYTGAAHEECFDINECGRSGSCGINAKCINIPGSYKCICPQGFTGQGQLYCENINECETNPCGENAVCKDTVGSFVCSCKEDYTGDPFRGCVDINECVSLEKPCGTYAICENAVPGYNCICPQGYQASPSPQVACEQIDVNILCKSNFDCTNNAECIDNQCFCQKGFVPQGATCVDINECESHPCGAFAICTNTIGSFQCECENSYVGSPPTIPCKAPCEDVKCGQHAFCKPDGQEAYCICEDGWTFNPHDIAAGCIDIDECDKANGPNGRCGLNAICTNAPGSFSCQCPEGYSGNPAVQCLDVDECLKPNSCGMGAVCTNLPGSYSCACPEGSVPDPDPHIRCNEIVTCRTNDDCPGNAMCDIHKRCICPEPNIGNDCRHPCESVFCGPNQHCMLLNQEAQCICSAGYTGTNTGCVDIDECAGNPCPVGAICKNEPGRFSCQCPGGTSGDPYRSGCSKTEHPSICSAAKPCPPGEQCIADDFIGESVCICVQGYIRDKETGKCRDINECTDLRDKPACGFNAVCKNLPGSYDCQCPPGFNGNPFSECIGKIIFVDDKKFNFVGVPHIMSPDIQRDHKHFWTRVVIYMLIYIVVMAANSEVGNNSALTKPCKKCKKIAQSGLKCIVCGTVSHNSCVELLKNIVQTGDKTINCCVTGEALNKGVVHSAGNVDSLQVEISYLKLLLEQKDLVISQQKETIASLKEQIVLVNKCNSLSGQQNVQRPSMKTDVGIDLHRPSSDILSSHKGQETNNLKQTVFDKKTVANAILQVKTQLKDKAHAATTDDQPFTVVSNKKRKNKRNITTIVGTLNDNKVNLKSAPKVSFLHVYKAHPKTTVEELMEFLKPTFPEVICEKLKSKHPLLYTSFKVTINENNLSAGLDPSAWPSGYCVNRFFHRSKPAALIK